jgi:hypothetical protein
MSVPERSIPARWSKDDPDAPSALDLVAQLHKVFYAPDVPLPMNVVQHWDVLLEEVEDDAGDDDCDCDCTDDLIATADTDVAKAAEDAWSALSEGKPFEPNAWPFDELRSALRQADRRAI